MRSVVQQLYEGTQSNDSLKQNNKLLLNAMESIYCTMLDDARLKTVKKMFKQVFLDETMQEGAVGSDGQMNLQAEGYLSQDATSNNSKLSQSDDDDEDENDSSENGGGSSDSNPEIEEETSQNVHLASRKAGQSKKKKTIVKINNSLKTA